MAYTYRQEFQFIWPKLMRGRKIANYRGLNYCSICGDCVGESSGMGFLSKVKGEHTCSQFGIDGINLLKKIIKRGINNLISNAIGTQPEKLTEEVYDELIMHSRPELEHTLTDGFLKLNKLWFILASIEAKKLVFRGNKIGIQIAKGVYITLETGINRARLLFEDMEIEGSTSDLGALLNQFISQNNFQAKFKETGPGGDILKHWKHTRKYEVILDNEMTQAFFEKTKFLLLMSLVTYNFATSLIAIAESNKARYLKMKKDEEDEVDARIADVASLLLLLKYSSFELELAGKPCVKELLVKLSDNWDEIIYRNIGEDEELYVPFREKIHDLYYDVRKRIQRELGNGAILSIKRKEENMKVILTLDNFYRSLFSRFPLTDPHLVMNVIPLFKNEKTCADLMSRIPELNLFTMIMEEGNRILEVRRGPVQY